MIYIGSSPLKNCFVGSTQVKAIYVGSTLYWSSSKTITVTLDGHSTAVLTIDGTQVKTSTSTFTYDAPYGSSVSLTVTADTYYYIPSKSSDTYTYTNSSLTDDVSLSVTTAELLVNLYINPAMQSSEQTINGVEYFRGMNIIVQYKEPGSTWKSIGAGVSDFGTNRGPWTIGEIPFGTSFRFNAGSYQKTNLSSGSKYAGYYVSTGTTSTLGGTYKDSSIDSTSYTPTSTTNYCISWMPQWVSFTGTVQFSGYNNKTTTYYIVAKANGTVVSYKSLKSIMNTSGTYTFYLPAKEEADSVNASWTRGKPATLQIGISTTTTGSAWTKGPRTYTVYQNTSGNTVNLNSTST